MIPEHLVERVRRAVDHDALVRLTAELVSINSVWDPGAGTSEQPAAEHVAAWARARGFEVIMDEVAPGRPNVVVRWTAGRGARRLLFEGHTDVVTPGDPAAWHHDPFSARIVGTRMYGRGTNDTKGNLAAMLVAMDALQRSGVDLAGSLIGAVLCDEEDQMLGVLDFIARGHADDVTGAVICEPQDGLICTCQKGAIRVRFTIQGRMSHGAMPLAGLNPAPAVARLIDGLGEIERAALAEHGRDPLLGWPSMTPTVIQAPASGPAQLNVMPGEARLLVDLRTIPGQNHDRIRRELNALAERVRQTVARDYAQFDTQLDLERDRNCRVQVAFLTDRPCTLTAAADPVVAAAAWASRTVTRQPPQYGGVPGATDGTFLWAKKQIPIVTMGAGDREVPHQVDEWVDLEQLKQTADIYALTALHYLAPGADG